MKNLVPYVLLNPGPVNTSTQVRKALMRGDVCHRESEFSQLLQDVRKNILKAFHVERDFCSVVLSGSGTAALEAALISCLDKHEKTLVINTGVYGDRIAEILKRHGFRRSVLSFELGRRPDLKSIEDALKKDRSIKSVAMVHHETSTGLLNPLSQIGRLCRRFHKRLIVDAISSLGGENFDFLNVDVCVGSANKCIQGLPGAAFVLIRKKLIPIARRYKRRSLYFDLVHLLEAQEKGGTPFTPAIPAFYAFDAALKEFIQEGVEHRVDRYQQYCGIIRKGLEKANLKYFVKNPSDRANTLTAYFLPEGWTYSQLHDALKKEGFVIYAGQGDLSKKIFRIANMGWLKKKDLERLVMIFIRLGICR